MNKRVERTRKRLIFFGIFCLAIVALVLARLFPFFFHEAGLMIPLLLIYVVGNFTLVIWMLIDCIRRDFKSKRKKWNWIGALIFFSPISPLVYFIKVKNRELSSDITIGSSE